MMKKYLHLLIVALFATLTFALTSCGDDDEPETPEAGGKLAFTINGEKYSTHSAGATPIFTTLSYDGTSTIDLELYPAKSDESDIYPRCHVNVEVTTPANLTKGVKLSIKNNNSTYAEMVTDLMEGKRYTDYKSGNITIEAASADAVTLKFDNVKFEDDNNAILTLNGTITCEYTEL